MSSIVDAVLTSDNAQPALDSEADAYSSRGGARESRGTTPRRNAPPIAPPSESAGPQSDAGAGFLDDEVVGIRGNRAGFRPKGPVEPVVDKVAEVVSKQFENFLDS